MFNVNQKQDLMIKISKQDLGKCITESKSMINLKLRFILSLWLDEFCSF